MLISDLCFVIGRNLIQQVYGNGRNNLFQDKLNPIHDDSIFFVYILSMLNFSYAVISTLSKIPVNTKCSRSSKVHSSKLFF